MTAVGARRQPAGERRENPRQLAGPQRHEDKGGLIPAEDLPPGNSGAVLAQHREMSYLHRPLAGAQATSATSGLNPSTGVGTNPSASRLADLLDFVKQEFEGVASQTDQYRRENIEYAAHCEFL